MKQNFKNIFQEVLAPEPNPELLAKIIFLIKKEKEARKERRLVMAHLFLLVFSVLTIPFSSAMLFEQINHSGFPYFISAALSNFGLALSFWKEFLLAFLESLPVFGFLLWGVHLIVLLFPVRFFWQKRNLSNLNLINFKYGRS